MFRGKTLLIATKHNKENVIASIFEKELVLNCIVSSNFDTDELGTFTREVERKNDLLITVKNKCLLALAMSKCDVTVTVHLTLKQLFKENVQDFMEDHIKAKASFYTDKWAYYRDSEKEFP